MRIKMSTLRRLYDLPSYADEAAVRAAMRAAPPLTRAQAASKLATPVHASPARPAPRPARPRMTSQSVAAMSSSDLQGAQRGALADAERRLIDEELDHRLLMGRHFPVEARDAGYAPVRWDPASRSGSVLKGVSS